MPAWPHSRSWGYVPSGGLGLLRIVVLVLVLMGRFWARELALARQSAQRARDGRQASGLPASRF
ncbi:hypothetical protein OR16_18756 [Cupriavidus basilensis OR16]|uniref:Uncharacterized protein n=1 Tax=Cupriavidus basilensis OR16 TaxID=1127483 RepID=H1S750_9BURK|nr:hypothetical protein OR16_18756 [Cupriavidus basilensis OR16]